MNRAIVFIFNSATELSVNAIAQCAKAISAATGCSIENMIGQQYDENEIAMSLISGIRIGELESNDTLKYEALKYINSKFYTDLMMTHDMLAFAQNLSVAVTVAKYTGCDNKLVQAVKTIATMQYSDFPKKSMIELGMSTKAFEIIQRVASKNV